MTMAAWSTKCRNTGVGFAARGPVSGRSSLNPCNSTLISVHVISTAEKA